MVNCGLFEMKIWPSESNSNLSNCEIAGKVFLGADGIRNRGLCGRAPVLYQLSYEDPYNKLFRSIYCKVSTSQFEVVHVQCSITDFSIFAKSLIA